MRHLGRVALLTLTLVGCALEPLDSAEAEAELARSQRQTLSAALEDAEGAATLAPEGEAGGEALVPRSLELAAPPTPPERRGAPPSACAEGDPHKPTPDPWRPAPDPRRRHVSDGRGAPPAALWRR